MIQNAAVRALVRARRNGCISPILRLLHWLPVSFRIDFKALLLVFKAINGNGPKYLPDMLQQYNSHRSLRSQERNLIIQPVAKTKVVRQLLASMQLSSGTNSQKTYKNAPTIPSFKSVFLYSTISAFTYTIHFIQV